MTCSTCNDYKTQIRNAITNRRYEQAEAIKALYVQHLAQAHAGEMTSKPGREKVRAAFGRFGS